MAKKIIEGDRITVGWDYNHRNKEGTIPVIYIHYKRDKVVFANENDLQVQLLRKMDEIDRRQGRPTRPQS